MFKITRGRLAVFAVLMAILGAAGIWTLLNPASLLVQPWRAGRSHPAEGVIFGPYPVEEDFAALKAEGVTRIVSLLNPVVPYEKVLLDQERERARRHGIELVNFPMGSILGQKFGDDYVANSRAAAQSALSANGTAYIHCYLGVNRAKYVQRYLASLAPDTSRNYAGTGGTLAMEDIDAFQRVQAAYKAHDHARALKELGGMRGRNPQALRMEGWSNYRVGVTARARDAFSRILAELPDDADATTGLGYCALRGNDLDAAERHFSRATTLDAQDTAAVEGLAHVRFRQGRHGEARELFERALERNPSNVETRQMIERLTVPGVASEPTPMEKRA